MLNPKDYIKLKKIGTTISYKYVYKYFFGEEPDKGYLKEKIGGEPISDLKGYWIDVDERITINDLQQARKGKIKPIFIIVDGRLYPEEVHGRINKAKNIAYIKTEDFMNLF